MIMKQLAILSILVAALAPCSIASMPDATAQGAIPKDVQQIICVDYRAMSNSPTAMALKKKVLPDELKKLEDALRGVGITPERDVDSLTFASFRTKGGIRIVGVANGEFQNTKVFAQLKKQKIQPKVMDKESVYPMGGNGMSMTLLNRTTMLFGESSALKSALDAYSGDAESLNANKEMLQLMAGLAPETVWSTLDQAGTQTMLKNALGEAAQLGEYENVKGHILNSRYTMNFDSGVDFNLLLNTSDNVTAATLSSLLKAGILFKKDNGTAAEKSALGDMVVDSDNSKLLMRYKADDRKFLSLLNSDLFQNVVR